MLPNDHRLRFLSQTCADLLSSALLCDSFADMPHGRITLPVSGDRIRDHREKAGLTLRDLAKRCAKAGKSVSDSQLSKIERELARPRPQLLKTLADVFDVDVEQLLDQTAVTDAAGEDSAVVRVLS